MGNGRLGATEQTDKFVLIQGRHLLADLKAKHPNSSALTVALAGIERRPSGAGQAKANKARLDTIYILYEGSSQVEGGDPPIEPFMVDLFRTGVLEGMTFHSSDCRDRSWEKAESVAFPINPPLADDLLVAPKHLRRMGRLFRELSGEDRIVIPLVQFYHAMALARIAARCALRWGPRIGEILQIRCDEECFPKTRTGLEGVSYMMLLPKGWSVPARFGIDDVTRRAIFSIERFMRMRWYGGASAPLQLPSVEFGDYHRRNKITPAPYVFAKKLRALRSEHLTFFIRVLLIGVVDIRTHDGRRAFATILADKGADYEVIGDQLHHRPGSEVTTVYDMRNVARASAAAAAHNREIDAELMGHILK